jgi:UDP-N-acetyl-D-galactosamine dehydrogenase
MGGYVADQVVKHMVKKDIHVKGSNILMLGFTFKENCPDVRNTRVIDIVNELGDYRVNLTIYDPWANLEEVKHEYGIVIVNQLPANTTYDAIVLAVAHDEFKKLDLKKLSAENSVLYDVKGILPKTMVDSRL